jgi:SpoVK/Ycf46/Vps4 family AAA+-type ATPase
VFRAILKGVEKESGFSYHRCAEITEGYTPSDIVALCKAALAIPTREWRRALMKERKRAESRKNVSDNSSSNSSSSSSVASNSGSATAKDSPGAHAATERHKKPRPLSIRVSNVIACQCVHTYNRTIVVKYTIGTWYFRITGSAFRNSL